MKRNTLNGGRSGALGMALGMGLGLRVIGLAGVGVVGAIGLSAVAQAEVRGVTPYSVVISKDRAIMRCADANLYYPVAELKTGDVLKVDGEGGGWLRVIYPAGLRAFVKVDEGAFDAATQTLKLTKQSSLMAANATGARHWWTLLEKDREMPAGTVFNNAQIVKGADGSVEGYFVPAPAKARGYIRVEQTRKVTAEEGGAAPVATAPPATNPGTTNPGTNAPVVNKPAAPVNGPATPVTPAGPVDTTIVRVDPKTKTQTPIDPANPPVEDPGTSTTRTTTTTTTQTVPTRTTSPEITKRIDDVAALREIFERVMNGANSDAEVQTAINEFNRKIDSLGTSGEEGQLRKALQDRRQALDLRQEIIETRRKISDSRPMDDRARQVQLALENVQKQAIYTIVGKMLPSTVYDGQRGMPLMYRIETVDGSSTRTLGYIVPREGMDLLTKLGKVVGIVGEAKFDSALALNIVAPTRVDEFQIVGGRLELVPVPSNSGVNPATGTGKPIPETKTDVPPTNPGGSHPMSPVPATTEPVQEDKGDDSDAMNK